jgi:hypothetical protein
MSSIWAICCCDTFTSKHGVCAEVRHAVRRCSCGAGLAEVKVFYAGVRWGLSLQPNAVRSRQLLAKALNDAFVGEIMSVGQGECLSVVFLDVNGSVAELGPTKWRNSKANTAQWKALAKTAARLYVSSPEASLYGML